MTFHAVLVELLNRLEACQGQDLYVGDGELREWPPEAVAALKCACVLVKARPASRLVCPGCEKQCTKDVDVFLPEGARPARAYIYCDEPEDKGRIEVELTALEQWRITGGILADALARLLGITKTPLPDKGRAKWTLGALPGRENKGAVMLSIENGGALLLAAHTIPLVQVFTLNEGDLSVDHDALGRIIDGAEPPRTLFENSPRHARRDAEIRAKYAELAQLGRRNYVKEIQRTVLGAELLSGRRIRDIVKGR